MIFITVGSRPYPFDRLFKEVDHLIEKGVINDEVFAQIGSSKYKPKNYNYKAYISPKDFEEYITISDLVISHGASGSIVKALKAEKKVLAVTRLEKYGEHIDDHQIQMNKAFEMHNLVVAVYDLKDLEKALYKVKSGELSLSSWNSMKKDNPIKIIEDFIDQNWK